eukprot:gene9062-biopygen9779
MRSRARAFARAQGRRLYWSIARDWLSGAGTRRAWADRMGGLKDQKLGWLGLDDMMTGRRLGCLPLCVGMPVRLSDHLNRPLGLVTGVRGTVREIWVDGQPPELRNPDGDYLCERPPMAVVVDFEGFDEPVTVGRSCKRWELRTGTATGIRDLHILRDFDDTRLRRGASKAGVDILLHRLRGTLSDATNRKPCVRCHKMLPRRDFLDDRLPDPARRWLAGKDRWCLACDRRTPKAVLVWLIRHLQAGSSIAPVPGTGHATSVRRQSPPVPAAGLATRPRRKFGRPRTLRT